MKDYSHSAEILSSKLNCLQSLGLSKPTVSVEESKLLGSSLLLTYTSASAHRSIEVGYVAADAKRAASASIFIVGQNRERFSLEDWLLSSGRQDHMRFVAARSESENNFLDQLAAGLCSLGRSSLHSTLVGDAWDAVPFNWKGYR
jgi:hypothetical protein